ncbi:hypothetical protein SKAU_G00041090 [Synaphobranchus kaupii]|uniref:Uncharacterized protein n=1 Tax=Synaphobranchus kaupii TaxID=118154 RepID=A0A9Q1J6N0_SYNKA|nr:hypothetical protein SKAU_G00041090 [Synaphobranchus kaupii]
MKLESRGEAGSGAQTPRRRRGPQEGHVALNPNKGGKRVVGYPQTLSSVGEEACDSTIRRHGNQLDGF